jgi:hypothetical protein
LSAGLRRRSGRNPWPGVPSSVKSPRRGSPVRSSESNVTAQLKSENRLLPSDVTWPRQAGWLRICRPDTIVL